MTTVSAIFQKQSKDMFRNFSVLLMFIIFPLVALALENLISNPYMESGMFAAQMASMFIAMSLIMSVSAIIAGDRETGSMKFLTLAGVKPISYIIGTGGVVFFGSIFTSTAFGFIGGIELRHLITFLPVMLSAAIASILLGATIGLIVKNSQAANGMAMPLGMALAMGPIAASFNDTVARVFSIVYTQQVDMVVRNPAMNVTRPLITIWLNILVLVIIFAIVYNKKSRKKES